ncbi:MAG: cadmium-translocating P-type ATPase [Clostridia bacterium]|nr:cadmium-translocating P-type ATPase [Clostridia bacterium]
MEIKLFLKGLGCANCAKKVEEQTQKLEGIEMAAVNFATGIMSIELSQQANRNFRNILKEIEKIIKTIEPQVEVIVVQENTEEPEDEEIFAKKHIFKLGIGIIFFVAAIFYKGNLSLELALFLISYFLIGGEVLARAINNIRRGQIFDENFLMSIATIGAFIVGEYPEGVAVMLFYQIGETFQDMAVNKSRRSIKALLDIKPDYANLLENGIERKVDPENVSIGDIIIIKPGERVPLDGIIVEGTTMVDTAALTGESVPRKIEVGEELLSGSINLTGLVKVEVTKRFGESTVNRIIQLVQNAGSRKAPTENFITKFARIYTPVVVFLAVALAVIPPLILEGAFFSQWFYRALIFLVISCPCALVISIPLSFFGGIGGASRNGILVKGGNFLEALKDVSTVVFDKTGTLTKGVFKVTEVKPSPGFSQEKLLEYAALAEAYSNHPIAKSISQAYGKEIDKALIKTYEEMAGLGVKVICQGHEILAGNNKLLKIRGLASQYEQEAETVVHIIVDGVYAGSILISDEIKKDAVDTIKKLREMGIEKIVMLTGDNGQVAKKVAGVLGVDRFFAELLPENKIEKLEALIKEKNRDEKLVFVGDGINDAPVLARADIGIAMGGLGSDAAIEAADVVLMTDEPGKLVTAIKIAKRTNAIVRQNIIFSLGVKFLVLILGALGLASMWAAVFADVGVALLAVLNAMRVMQAKV